MVGRIRSIKDHGMWGVGFQSQLPHLRHQEKIKSNDDPCDYFDAASSVCLLRPNAVEACLMNAHRMWAETLLCTAFWKCFRWMTQLPPVKFLDIAEEDLLEFLQCTPLPRHRLCQMSIHVLESQYSDNNNMRYAGMSCKDPQRCFLAPRRR